MRSSSSNRMAKGKQAPKHPHLGLNHRHNSFHPPTSTTTLTRSVGEPAWSNFPTLPVDSVCCKEFALRL